jgi:DNA-binding NarL/FixJ family response regulator
MASHALVLSIDPHSSQLVRGVLKEFDVKADLCLSANSAKRLLRQNRYESVIVDCDSVADGLSIFEELRNSRENRGAVTVTLLNDSTQMRAATEVGSTFMLHKPIPAEDARRIMRIARHLIARDSVRQYLRLPMNSLAFALLNEEHQIVVENVSEGGMAIQADEQLEAGSECQVRFILPVENIEIAAKAKVKWADAAGRAGLQFTAIAEESHRALCAWIEDSYANGLPDVDGNRRVALDIPARMTQRRAWMRKIYALMSRAAVDVGIPLLATATFALIARAIAGHFLPVQTLFLPTLLFCAAYHYLFVTHQKKTPGALVAARIE